MGPRVSNPRATAGPERDDFSSNRHRALLNCWSMIFSENRYPPRIKSGAGFFGIMLYVDFRCGRRLRASAMTSGTAASLAGAMMWTPATPGTCASSSISSIAMRAPSAAGSAARSRRSMKAVGDDGAVEVLRHPARRLGRAQRRDADQQEEAAGRGVLGEARGVAPHDPSIHAELGLHELGAGCDLGRELVRPPAGRRVDRHIGGAEKELRAARHLASGREHALVAQVARHRGQGRRIDVEHRLGVGLVAGLGVVAGEAQQVAHAAGGGAHQLALQRDAVAVAAGELEDRLDAFAREHRRRDRRRQMRARAGAVGDVDGVGETAQRQGLAQEIIGIARDRRRDLGGDDELAGSQQLFQARSRLSRRWIISVRRSWRDCRGRGACAGGGGCLYSRSTAEQ